MYRTADALAHAIDPEARKAGREWRLRCPVHGGKSLQIRDGRKGPLLHCFGGCSNAEVIDALRGRGLWAPKSEPRKTLSVRFTPGELEYFHLWCLTYRDNVRAGYVPTLEEDRQFKRFSRITYKQGMACGPD